MEFSIKTKKISFFVCFILFSAVVLLSGCRSKTPAEPGSNTSVASDEYFEPAYSIFEPESTAEKYIYLGAKIRAGDRMLGTPLKEYVKQTGKEKAFEYEYKFYRPGSVDMSNSIPFITLMGEIPEGAISAERSITLDFTHELYNYKLLGVNNRATYNPMITDKWVLKNNSGEDIKIKAAYPFRSYNNYINIYLDDGVRHSVPSFDVSGADADITYAVAPIIEGYPNTEGFTPYDIVRQKLLNGYYLKEALADDWKVDDEIIIYDITLNSKPEDGRRISFFFTVDSKKTMVLEAFWKYNDSYPRILESDDPDLTTYWMNVDNEGRYPQRLVILGEDLISKGFFIRDEYHFDSGEIIELPEDEFTIERTTSTVDDYYFNEGTAMRWGVYTYESKKDNMPVEVYRQWVGYVVKQSLIDYFTSANHAADDDPLAKADFTVSPLVYYIAEFTIPANGEVTLDISYMDRNAIYNFLCPDDPAYDLGKTEITVIKNDTMIIVDQNLGFKTKGNKLTEDVSTVTFDTLKPGLYFEYRDYWV